MGDIIVSNDMVEGGLRKLRTVYWSKGLGRNPVKFVELVTEVGFISEIQFCDDRNALPSFSDELPGDAAPQSSRPIGRSHIERAREETFQVS